MIDEVTDLMKLSGDELNESLLEERYNKANLRELVRRTIVHANKYKRAYEYEASEKEKAEEKLSTLQSKMQNLL